MLVNDPYFSIALRRIEAEAKANTGAISFSGLRIACIPKEIERLANLRSVDLSFTDITSLQNLEPCRHLKILNCSYAPLNSLAGIEDFPKLTHLYCAKTGISNFDGLERCQRLAELHCSGCHITSHDGRIWDSPALKKVIFYPGLLEGVASELLSGGPVDTEVGVNCLPRLRDNFRAGREGLVKVRAIKLFLLGNGAVGKTQIGRMLRGLPYKADWPSTHGVDVHRFALGSAKGLPLTVNMWDFGGQAIYHGAHALFLRSRSIYLLAWSPGHEQGTHIDAYGMSHVNHPLDYWLDFARTRGGVRSPVLIVQAQCDTPGQVVLHPPVSDARLKRFRHRDVLNVSAAKRRKRTELIAAIQDAAKTLLDGYKYTEIPVSWVRVIEGIAAMRPDESAVPVADRKNRKLKAGRARTLDREGFNTLCVRCGVESGNETLLHYLVATGELFYRPGIFHDQLIIDQDWTLDAVYAVFERGRCFERLIRAHGRFDAQDLADWLWDDQAYGTKEQELFLSFMLSCKLCFPLYWIGDVQIYIAPAALPAFEDMRVTQHHSWREGWPMYEARYVFDLLHDGFIGALIAEVGRRFRLEADYWCDGAQLYDRQSDCRMRLRRERGDRWEGSIVVEVQYPPGGDEAKANELFDDLCALIQRQENWTGLHARQRPGLPTEATSPTQMGEQPAELLLASGTEEGVADPGQSASLTWNSPEPRGSRAVLIQRIYQNLRFKRPSQFDLLIMMLNIPVDRRPPESLTTEEKSVAIIRWAEEANALDRLLRQIESLAENQDPTGAR